MSLSPGTRIGPYEVTAPIGEGGMGEVYRARDTSLGRDVAIEVVPDAFAHDAERLGRFEREAKTLASLNHPNIAQIYGLEKGETIRAIIMELVEGPTLADRIAQGAIPVDEALPIAKQIAEALEAAHEQGIIHRDLKPANIKLRPDGTVKVLDFGLAKALEPVSAGSVDATASPTITSPAMMTGVGMLLGTAAYMSPEQARGKAVDKRSDIWAFGCVLYEMLTGRRAFPGEDVPETLAAVLMRDVDWSAVPGDTPMPVRVLLQGCLERDPRRRVGDVSTALFVLRGLAHLSLPSRAVATHDGSGNRSMYRVLAFAGITSLFVAIGAWTWGSSMAGGTPAAVRLEAGLGADVALHISGPVGSGASTVISPDGSTLAFVARAGAAVSQLYVRRLDQLQAQPLSGTEDASNPFFSPDGEWVAFFAEGRLKKVPVTGGIVVTLCDAPAPRGGSWTDNDTIVFQARGNTAPLLRVSSAGGMPETLIELADGEGTQRWPQVLPGSGAVLFTSNVATSAGYRDASIVVQTLATGARKVLQERAISGRYLRSGHLVFVREHTLFAAPFDVERLEITGAPIPIVEGVASSIGNGGAQVSVSDNGTLVYLPGLEVDDNTEPDDAAMAWLDRSGQLTTIRSSPSDWTDPQFSPDGRRLAFDLRDDLTSPDIWIFDWARNVLSRLTIHDSSDTDPIWTPDGRRITFRHNRDGRAFNLYWQSADGNGDAQRLTDSRNNQFTGSWHPGGRSLAFSETVADNNQDLMLLPIEGDEASGWKPGTAMTLLDGPFAETSPTFSSDGRWLAHVSNETGRNEVYVRAFPGMDRKQQVSTGGGNFPIWSRVRQELYYETSDNRIMRVPYRTTGDTFEVGSAESWSPTGFLRRRGQRNVALHPGGERFLIAPRPDRDERQAGFNSVTFVFNFFEELQRLVPAD